MMDMSISIISVYIYLMIHVDETKQKKGHDSYTKDGHYNVTSGHFPARFLFGGTPKAKHSIMGTL